MIKKKNIVELLFVFSACVLCFQEVFFIPINKKNLLDAGKLINTNVGSLIDAPSENDSLGMALAKTVVDSQLTEKLGFGTSDLQALKNLLPIAKFFQTFPASVIASQDTWDYKNNEVVIKSSNKNIATNELESTIMLRCNLQFKNHGDVLSPIGYKILNGRFYFNPGMNILEIKKVNSGKTEVKNLLSPSLKNSLIKATGTLTAGNLISANNLTTASAGINTFFTRTATLYPQDIFVLKIIQLINTANKNSLAGSSYPRIAHIPLELMLLFKRLSITPNYEATMKNNGSNVKAAYQWDPSKIIFFQDPVQAFQDSIVNINSTFLNAIKSSIQLSISSEEWALYGNTEKIISDINQTLKNNINLAWNSQNYNERSDFIANTLIENNNFVAFSEEEQKVFLNNIAFHLSQRYSGVVSFSVLLNSLANNKVTEKSTDVPTINNIDLNIILKSINKRIPKIKIIIEKIKNLLNGLSASSNPFLNEAAVYFDNQSVVLGQEIDALKTKITNLINIQAKIVDPATSEQDVINVTKELTLSLQDFIAYILEQESLNVFLPSVIKSDKINLSIDKYLNCKINQSKNISLIKFRGDDGFMSNPLPLNDRESIEQSMAILLRSIELMQKAGDLFKADPNIYKMYDLNGTLVDVKGSDIYAKTITLNQKMSLAVEKKEYELKNQSIASGFSIQDSGLNSAIQQVESAQNSLSTEYVHYLRQYNFDTREKNSTISALAKIDNTNLSAKISEALTKTVVSKDSLDRKDFEYFIKTNLFFGNETKFKFGKKVIFNYLSNIKKSFVAPEIQTIKQGELSIANKSLVDQNLALSNLRTSLNTLTDNDTSKTSLMGQISDSAAIISLLEKKVVRLNLQLKNLTQIPAWIDKTIDKINKLVSSQVLLTEFNKISADSEPMIFGILQTLNISADNINALKKASADYFVNKSSGYENVYSALQEIINNNNPILANSGIVDKESSLTPAQISSFSENINQEMDLNLNFTKFLTSMSVLEKILTVDVFDKITALPAGIYSSLDEINKIINPTSPSTSMGSTTRTSSISSAAKADTLKNIFKSNSPDYASNINSFLSENLIKLSQKSSLSSFLPLILDPVLISTFGCNMATIMSQVDEKQKIELQNELISLLEESTTDDGNALIKIPQETLQKALSIESLSEMSQMITTNSDQALDIFAVQASPISENSIGTVSVGLNGSTITQADGATIDQTTSLKININTSIEMSAPEAAPLS